MISQSPEQPKRTSPGEPRLPAYGRRRDLRPRGDEVRHTLGMVVKEMVERLWAGRVVTYDDDDCILDVRVVPISEDSYLSHLKRRNYLLAKVWKYSIDVTQDSFLPHGIALYPLAVDAPEYAVREKWNVYGGPSAFVPGAVAFMGFDPPAPWDRSRITMVVKSIQSCVNREEIKKREADGGKSFFELTDRYKRWPSILAEYAVEEMKTHDYRNLRYEYRSKSCVQVDELRRCASRRSLDIIFDDQENKLVLSRSVAGQV